MNLKNEKPNLIAIILSQPYDSFREQIRTRYGSSIELSLLSLIGEQKGSLEVVNGGEHPWAKPVVSAIMEGLGGGPQQSSVPISVESDFLVLSVMVIDRLKHPIPESKVRVGNLTKTTDIEGQAELSLRAGKYRVEVSKPGFTTDRREADLKLENVLLQIQLDSQQRGDAQPTWTPTFIDLSLTDKRIIAKRSLNF
jgi:hypothetical protein